MALSPFLSPNQDITDEDANRQVEVRLPSPPSLDLVSGLQPSFGNQGDIDPYRTALNVYRQSLEPKDNSADLWGALAQFGFGTAASRSPHFLQSLAEGARAGSAALADIARKKEADKLRSVQAGLQLAQYDRDKQLSAAAAERQARVDAQKAISDAADIKLKEAQARYYLQGGARGRRGGGGGDDLDPSDISRILANGGRFADAIVDNARASNPALTEEEAQILHAKGYNSFVTRTGLGPQYLLPEPEPVTPEPEPEPEPGIFSRAASALGNLISGDGTPSPPGTFSTEGLRAFPTRGTDSQASPEEIAPQASAPAAPSKPARQAEPEKPKQPTLAIGTIILDKSGKRYRVTGPNKVRPE